MAMPAKGERRTTKADKAERERGTRRARRARGAPQSGAGTELTKQNRAQEERRLADGDAGKGRAAHDESRQSRPRARPTWRPCLMATRVAQWLKQRLRLHTDR